MPRYIDADAILKDMCAWCTNFENDIPVCKEKECAYTLLVKSAPTANVQETNHGHWTKDPESGETRCSECDWSLETAWESNYCPDCGAKMYE